MKKVLMTLLLTSLGFTAIHAQKTTDISVRGSVPLGAFSDSYTFGIDADISYHSFVYENLMLGGSVGYGHLFGETEEAFGVEVTVDDYNYVPLLGSVKVLADDLFFLALQPGYALALGEDTDGGFMFRAKAGYNLSYNLDLVVSYQNILVEVALPTVGLGLNFYP